MNDRLYFKFSPAGGWCPPRKRYRCDRITLGTRPEDQDWDYDKKEYDLEGETIGKMICHLYDSEIMALEVFNDEGRRLLDASGNWNMSKDNCKKRIIALSDEEKIVGMNFVIKKERMECFVALIWNML